VTDTPEPLTLIWKGETIFVSREGWQWALVRAGRRVLGPRIAPKETWEETVARIQLWLDRHGEP
jgi:hypothetical protein